MDLSNFKASARLGEDTLWGPNPDGPGTIMVTPGGYCQATHKSGDGKGSIECMFPRWHHPPDTHMDCYCEEWPGGPEPPVSQQEIEEWQWPYLREKAKAHAAQTVRYKRRRRAKDRKQMQKWLPEAMSTLFPPKE